jgi:Flp pilus assembly protein TadG
MTKVAMFKPFTARAVTEMFSDCRAIAATEFALIVPLMLVLFFGTVEFSSAVAVDRKITIFSRAISDITSQAPATTPKYAVTTDTLLQNAFTSGIMIMRPYLQNSSSSLNATVSEIYVDSSGTAKIVWSMAAVISQNSTQATLTPSTTFSPGDIVTNMVPPPLLQKQTYLIFSQTKYLFTPAVDFGGLMAKTGVTLSDFAYSAPRQATCVVYNNVPILVAGLCPQS